MLKKRNKVTWSKFVLVIVKKWSFEKGALQKTRNITACVRSEEVSLHLLTDVSHISVCHVWPLSRNCSRDCWTQTPGYN